VPNREFVVFQDAHDASFHAMTRENIRFLGDLLGFAENNVTVIMRAGRKVLDRS
jgi:hypothetical protein